MCDHTSSTDSSDSECYCSYNQNRHKCSHIGCDRYYWNDDNYCRQHKCRKCGCCQFNNGNKYCDQHRCDFPMCSKIRKESNYCSRHTCSRCSGPIYIFYADGLPSTKGYCLKHS